MEQAKTQKNVLVSGINAIAIEVYNNIDNYRSYNPKTKDRIIINEGLIRHEHNLTQRDAKLVNALVEKKLDANNKQ